MKNLISPGKYLHQVHFAIIFFCCTLIVPDTAFSAPPGLPIARISKPLIFPDFDEALMRGERSKITYKRRINAKNSDGKQLELKHQLEILRTSYKQTVAYIQTNLNTVNTDPRIPRIIHQIWLGSNVPPKYFEWMKTWMNWHGWEYKLWTDEEVKKIQLRNQNIFQEVKNYGAKSDILRMEILYMIGGIYVDTDFECLNPDFFEILTRHVDFYIGIEPLEHTSSLRINNAIIGSAPGHPLLQKMICDLPEHYQANKKKWPLISTGPVFITKVIFEYLKQDHPEYNLFLPCSLVYPFSSREVDHARSPESLTPMRESAAIHYWSKSWVKQKGLQKLDNCLQID